MIVDTSALVAIVIQEPAYEDVLTKLTAPTAVAGIGTPTVAELGIVLSARLGIDARSHVVELLNRLDIAEVPFGEAHWREAVDAYWRLAAVATPRPSTSAAVSHMPWLGCPTNRSCSSVTTSRRPTSTRRDPPCASAIVAHRGLR
jgi:uncharacterized protein with PIN domain